MGRRAADGIEGARKCRRLSRPQRFQVIRDFVTDVMSQNDPSHDLEHVLRVCRNVELILDSVEVSWSETDREIVLLAALCHECCDVKYVPDKTMAAERLTQALHSANIPVRSVRIIAEVVPLLSFSRRLREGMPRFSSDRARRVYEIVSDADYLEALGITGIIRTNVFQGVHGKDATSASHHIEHVLYKCVEHLSTPWAKKEGATRLECMQNAMGWYRREQSL